LSAIGVKAGVIIGKAALAVAEAKQCPSSKYQSANYGWRAVWRKLKKA